MEIVLFKIFVSILAFTRVYTSCLVYSLESLKGKTFMALLLRKTFTGLGIRFAFPEKFQNKPEKCATLVLTFVTYIKEDQ